VKISVVKTLVKERTERLNVKIFDVKIRGRERTAKLSATLARRHSGLLY
jgi:hypothetical protein